MDKIVAEAYNRPYYVVTDLGYKAYMPQYGRDVLKVLKNIGPEVGEDLWFWINHYWNQIW